MSLLQALTTVQGRLEGGVAHATFQHPPINLVGPETVRDLTRLLDMVEADDEIKVLVIASADPDYFFAHADMVALAQPREQPPNGSAPGRNSSAPAPFAAALIRLAGMSTVSIAKIAGRARGAGSEIALACDMRFASIERAILSQPEVGVGLLPGAGGTQRLPALLGRGRALEAILGAEDFDALTAERYGWINRALPDQQLDSFVDDLAARIASFPSGAIASAKEFVNRASLPSADGLAAESQRFAEHLRTPEVAQRVGRLIAQGAQTRSELELNLGAALGALGDHAV